MKELSILPQIPKRLASRVRSAYGKVESARGYVAYAEAKILDCQLHLLEYENNPEQFAQEYYPGRKGPLSDPVQTNINQVRALLERKIERMPHYLNELGLAEENLRNVEADIKREIIAMRPSTRGRVDWPPMPPTLDMLRKIRFEEFAHLRCLGRKGRAAQLHARKEWELKQQAEDQELNRLAEEDLQLALLKMPPEMAGKFRKGMRALRDAIDSGQFTYVDVLELANQIKE